MYTKGFDEIWSTLTEEETRRLMELRDFKLRELFEKQFVLIYHSNFTKADTDSMSLYELDKFNELLVEQKTNEANMAEGG